LFNQFFNGIGSKWLFCCIGCWDVDEFVVFIFGCFDGVIYVLISDWRDACVVVAGDIGCSFDVSIVFFDDAFLVVFFDLVLASDLSMEIGDKSTLASYA
jgi:hypothetical protein